MLKKLLIVSILCSTLCSLQIQAEESPATWTLEPLTFTLDQIVTNDFYLPEAGFKEVLQASLQRRLANSGNLVSTTTDDTLNIAIQVNYFRRFPGDLTPFPSATITSPDVTITIQISRNEQILKSYGPKDSVINDPSFMGMATLKSLARDIGHLTKLSNIILEQLNELTPELIVSTELTEEEAKTTIAHYLTLRQQQPRYVYESYIPAEVTEQYLMDLASPDRKTRLNTYAKLTRGWINEPIIYNKIYEKIQQEYQTATTKEDIKELREAMNALASSGMDDDYLQLFFDIERSTANRAIVKQVEDSSKIMNRRIRQNAVVHNTKTMNPDFDWITNQNINILKLPETDVRVLLLKRLYRNKLWNEPTLQAIANELEQSFFTNPYRTAVNTDVHSWMCILLGVSGNKKYQDLLQRLSEQSPNEKVRKHAKDNFKKLKKIKA